MMGYLLRPCNSMHENVAPSYVVHSELARNLMVCLHIKDNASLIVFVDNRLIPVNLEHFQKLSKPLNTWLK